MKMRRTKVRAQQFKYVKEIPRTVDCKYIEISNRDSMWFLFAKWEVGYKKDRVKKFTLWFIAKSSKYN